MDSQRPHPVLLILLSLPVTAVADAWVDQLIAGEPANDKPAHEQLADRDRGGLPWRFEFRPIAYRVTDGRGDNEHQERGFQIDYSTDTRDWGSVSLSATMLDVLDEIQQIDDQVYSANLRFSEIPVTQALQAELQFGDMVRYFRDDARLSVYLRPRRPAIQGTAFRLVRPGEFAFQIAYGESYGIAGQELSWFKNPNGKLLSTNFGHQIDQLSIFYEFWQLAEANEEQLNVSALSTGLHWAREAGSTSFMALID
ncbi:hypothetical protein OAS86_07265, partial [Gammaproteobacteria bacterium]|nr:hypothetical protein [Gammaproteobacteria bacterium]